MVSEKKMANFPIKAANSSFVRSSLFILSFKNFANANIFYYITK